MTIGILYMTILFTTVNQVRQADLTSTFGLEEAFVDAVANCGPIFERCGSIGKDRRTQRSNKPFAMPRL